MAEPPEEALASTHRYKLRLPLYDGNFATFEEWKYKFTAYMGLVHKRYPLLLQQVETATQTKTDTALRNAEATMEEAEENIQLAADLRYTLISITPSTAATVCRQHQAKTGFEIYRQLTTRFSIPKGTRGTPTQTNI